MKRSTKTARQLSREIAEALAKKSSRRQHATVREPSAEDTWDVAMDALLEGDAKRAIAIVKDLGPVPMTPRFSKALTKVPKSALGAFEKATGIVTKAGYDWKSFAEGATKAFWYDKYITEVENFDDENDPGLRRALSPGPGVAWEKVIPKPAAAATALGKKFAKAVRTKLTDEELTEVATKFSPVDAGYYGAMQSLGSGVGWFDEGVEIDPPDGFEYDSSLDNAVWKAVQQKAQEEGFHL